MSASFVKQFEDARNALPGAGLAWLDNIRETAIERFDETGFPTPRVESWKYTNLSRLSRNEFSAPDSRTGGANTALTPWLMAATECYRLVFVDGQFSAEQSAIGTLPEGVTLAPLAEIIENNPDLIRDALAAAEPEDGDGLLALNTALLRDGIVLRVDAGVALDRPVQLLHFATAGDNATAIHPRHLVTLGENSRATLLECYIGASGARNWTNAVMTIKLADGAKLDHHRLQLEGEDAYHVGLTRLGVARDAAYSGVALSVGAVLSRNEFRAELSGAGADCRIAGGALMRGRQHADITTQIDHAAPHTTSAQLFKNVLDDRSRAVTQGRVVVQPDAQKINADQTNRNLLLSPGARADSKPELRIFADDVKCSHGATVGDLDREAMFYLRSRGIPEDEARKLLIRAFAAELFDQVSSPVIRSFLEGALEDRIGSSEKFEAAA